MTILEIVEREIHAKVNTTITPSSTEIRVDKLYFKACNYKWIELLNRVIINDKEYRVSKSDDVNYGYMVLNYDLSTVEQIKLKNFYMYEGTPSDVTQVFSLKSNQTREKLPMMWLSFTPLPTFSGSEGSLLPYPFSSSFTLYFASSTDYATRYTKQHMRDVVAPLQEYVDEVLSVIRKNGFFGKEFSWTSRPLPKFGRLDRDGFVSNILDDTNMSAIELELDVNTSEKCKC